MINPADEHFSSIMMLTKKILWIVDCALMLCAPVVEGIISSDRKDILHIEHTFDSLLDFCFYKQMLELFRRLCRYYYFIYPEAAASYVFSYREMWDSEEGGEER